MAAAAGVVVVSAAGSASTPGTNWTAGRVAPDAAGWLASGAAGSWAITVAVIDASAGPDLLGAADDVLAPWKPARRAA